MHSGRGEALIHDTASRSRLEHPLLGAVCSVDGVQLEVVAPNEGILNVSAQEGDELDVGAVLGTVEAGEKPAKPAAESTGKTEQAGPAETSPAADTGGARASTVAKKIAQERGVDLKAVTGSGPSGRIMKADVMSATEKQAPAQSSHRDHRTCS